MDLLVDWQHSYQLNVILLSVVGLWPYGNKLILRLKRIVASYTTVCCCFCQLCTFLTVDYTDRLLLNNAPGIFVGCAICHKYLSALAASDSIKRATETINADFNELDNKEEIRIIQKYIDRGKFHTKGFAMFICPAGISLILFPFFSVFLDIVMPLNEPRNRSFPIMFEIFIDQKKHFFLAALIFDCCTIIAVFTFVSTETLLIVYILYACALFEITSCRIKKLVYITGSRNSNESSHLSMIAYVVKSHSRAIRQCKTITDDFLASYTVLLVFGIFALSAHLFRCAQALATRKFLEFLLSGMFGFGILGYIFYLNFVVQQLLDLSGGIFDDLYNINWYAFPASTRKLVLFCMLNSVRPITVKFSSLYDASYEGFSVILKMAMSYATALYSFQ